LSGGGNQLEDAVRSELRNLQHTLVAEVSDPAERVAIAQMTADLALVPIRMARGEDVASILAALKAESLNRALALRTRAEAAAQQAWIAVVSRILMGAISGALA
jgi:hypothetical protein